MEILNRVLSNDSVDKLYRIKFRDKIKAIKFILNGYGVIFNMSFKGEVAVMRPAHNKLIYHSKFVGSGTEDTELRWPSLRRVD